MDDPEAFSFVYGMLLPRVAVSRGLLESLGAAELQAVLEHERYHASNLDPLKLALARSLTAGFFLLPALGSLRARYVTGRELAADRRAIALCGSRPLAGALLSVVRGPEWSTLDGVAPIDGAAAVGGVRAISAAALLEARIVQLETGSQPRVEAPGFARWALSLLAAGMLTALFALAVNGFGGAAAVHRATGAPLAAAALLGSLACAAPFAGAGALAYALVALRGAIGRARPLP